MRLPLCEKWERNPAQGAPHVRSPKDSSVLCRGPRTLLGLAPLFTTTVWPGRARATSSRDLQVSLVRSPAHCYFQRVNHACVAAAFDAFGVLLTSTPSISAACRCAVGAPALVFRPDCRSLSSFCKADTAPTVRRATTWCRATPGSLFENAFYL